MISIIVPFYCTKRVYFERCMNSLLHDKDADVEVIIVDDGSPEEYRRVINRYTADRRVRVLYKDHLGVSAARNAGMDAARGKWLMFVDSDDYMEPDYAGKLQSIADRTDADFIFFNGYGDKCGHKIQNKYFVCENIDYGASVSLKCQVIGSGLSLGRTPEYYRCLYTLGSPYSKLIRRDFIIASNVRFDVNVKFAEDTLFSMNLILKADHIYYVNEYLYHYFMNEDSVTGRFRKGLSHDMNRFFKEAWRFMKENNLENMLKESFCIRAFLESQRCIRQEFCHKDNPESKARSDKKAVKFLSREPYKSALKADYPYLRKPECRAASYLLKRRMVREYMAAYGLLTWTKSVKNQARAFLQGKREKITHGYRN